MKMRFTHHARQKFFLVRTYGFSITQTMVKRTLHSPIRVDVRTDGTLVAMSLFDKDHVLRVAHRYEGDIIVIITFYIGRKKAYGV